MLDIVFLLGVGWLVWRAWPSRRVGQAVDSTPRRGRQLKPHSPRDCPLCRAADGQSAETRQAVVEPWSRHKSRRVRPKTVDSDGYACMNRACPYYRVTDGGGHALVSHGQRGKQERIQRWACEACGQTATARLNTAMYGLKTPSWRVAPRSARRWPKGSISQRPRVSSAITSGRLPAGWSARGSMPSDCMRTSLCTWCASTCNWTSW